MKCNICYDDIILKNTIALECGHIFHNNCIITLIRKRNRKCPNCRCRIKWNINQIKRHEKLFKNN